MTEPSLDGVWAKIGRAETHRDALEAKISDAFCGESGPPQIGLRFDEETGKHVLYVSQMRDFSELLQDCALVAGDLLNNLRSALDHLVYQLAVKCTLDNVLKPEATQFPICDFRRKYKGRGFLDKTRKDLKEVRGYWTRFEKLQPYPRRHRDPNRALAILRNLNNQDKHRLLVPAIIVPSGYVVPLNALSFEMFSALSSSDRVARSGSGALMVTLAFRSIELGTELERMTLTPEAHGDQMGVIGQITPAVSIGEQRAAVSLCNWLIDGVTETVGVFADAFQ